MPALVGIDMSIAANTIVAGGVLTALADADHWLGQQAAFVGRYLTAGVDPSRPVATPLTTDEVQWILAGQGRALMLIANATSASGVAAGWQQGLKDAALHIAAAQALGAPAETVLWFDIEDGWALNAAWVAAVVESCLQAGFRVGFYGALASPGFQQGWQQALQADGGNVGRALLWSARWVAAEGVSAANAPAWAPDSAGAGLQPAAWQFSGGVFGGIADEDEINTTLALAGMWLPPAQPAAAPPSTPAPQPSPSVDLAALTAGLAQAEAGLAAARKAAGL